MSSPSAADPFAPSPEAREAAGLVEGAATIADRFADRLNPIFVKEIRQAVKSKQFFSAFLLLLLVSWLISLVTVSAAGQRLDYGNWGRDLFGAYFVVLAAAILVVVPFSAFRSLMLEREEATFEPLIISTLSPRQIVFGKLFSALLQAFLFYSAIAPFMAFTALLQGFDVAYVATLLVLGLGVSAWVSVAALAISAMVHGRMWQTIVSLAVLFGLLFVFGTACALAFETWWLQWSDPWTVVALATWVAVGTANIVLLQEIAVANLTFQSDNRSTGLRLITEGHILLIWLGVGSAIWYFGGFSGSDADELLIVGVVLSILCWTVLGLFFVTEADGLSQRVVRRMPRLALWRVLAAPFYPGGARGLLLVLGNLLLIGGIVAGIARSYAKLWSADEVILPLACLLYLAIYFNLSAALSRWAMAWSPALQPLHCRVGTLVLIGLSMIVPLFLMLLESYDGSRDYQLAYLLNPILTLEELDRASAYYEAILILLSVGALLTTAVNLPAMARGLHEMYAATPTPEPSQSSTA